MASDLHCLYCFETLFTSFQQEALQDLEYLAQAWDAYVRSKKHGVAGGAITVPSRLQSLAMSQDQPPSSKPSPPSLEQGGLSMASVFQSRTSASVNGQNSNACSEKLPSHQKVPMFVTWNSCSNGGQKSLRGCIGTFEPQSLSSGLSTYALTSAFEDTRFAPISSRELPKLECNVTLLTDFESAKSPTDWELGMHGIRISFRHQSRRYGATYLPDVATEQGWTKSDTLVSLMRKAGYDAEEGSWDVVESFQLTRYQGQKATMEYATWQDFRKWMKN